jgi:hypothetical protein
MDVAPFDEAVVAPAEAGVTIRWAAEIVPAGNSDKTDTPQRRMMGVRWKY